MLRFNTEPIAEIMETLSRETLSRVTGGDRQTAVTFELPILPLDADAYPGEEVYTAFGPLRFRTLQNVTDMADALNCQLYPMSQTGPWMRFTLMPRSLPDRWHTATGGSESDSEKYGASSAYQRIPKLEDPCFYGDLTRSLKDISIEQRHQLISLGVNTGDELLPVYRLNPGMHCTGIDHSQSALAIARQRFEPSCSEFVQMDINQIHAIDEAYLHRYDVFMSLGTLHSPGVDSKRVFMWCMQHLLVRGAAVIVGFPNCRWTGGQVVYGARTRNRSEMDLSLVVKDIHFIKKYLQQHRFKVTVFGKYYLFVVGTPV